MARVCTRCVMDSSDSGVTFDEQGRCSVCTRYLEQTELRGYRAGRKRRNPQTADCADQTGGRGQGV